MFWGSKTQQDCKKCKMDFPVEILVSEHNLKQVLDSKKQGMGCVLPHKDFGQEKCKKPPKRYESPDGGSDELIQNRTTGQSVHNGSVIQSGADQRTVEA